MVIARTVDALWELCVLLGREWMRWAPYRGSSGLWLNSGNGQFRARCRALVVCMVAISAVFMAASPAVADPTNDDKKRADQKVQETNSALENATAKAQQAWADFASANEQLPTAQQAAAEAKGQVIAAQVQAGEAQRKADTAKHDMDSAQSAYDKADQQVQSTRRKFDTFVRTSYEESRYLTSSLVLAAKNPDQAVDAVEYVHAVSAVKQDQVTGMKAARLRAGEQRATVAEQKKQADQANANAHNALAEAQQRSTAADTAQQHVTDLANQKQNAYNVAQQEKDASQRQYEDSVAASNQIEQQLKAAAAQQEQQQRQQQQPAPRAVPAPRGNPPPAAHSSSGFIMPVVGSKSSDFGWRFDPYYHKWQLHAGTDLAAPTGTPIWAAAAGRVVTAGWVSGYGNYTCIIHPGMSSPGRSISTCYGHQSQLLVSVGQNVSQGQVIGKVGMTGAATGPHLHFEVRVNGAPTEPLNWL